MLPHAHPHVHTYYILTSPPTPHVTLNCSLPTQAGTTVSEQPVPPDDVTLVLMFSHTSLRRLRIIRPAMLSLHCCR